MILANIGILIANLIVLGLTLKPYTEYFENTAQNKRQGPHEEPK